MLEQKDLEMIAEIMEKTTAPRFERLESRFGKLEDKFDVLEGRFDKLEGRFDVLEGRFDKLEDKVEKIDNKVGKLDDKVLEIQLTLENETNKKISIVAEGHLDLSRKLDEALKVENEKEILLLRVTSLENEVRRLKARIAEIA